MDQKRTKFNIGISCIGSGVGQAVVSSLRLSALPVTTIGLGSNPFAFGAYDCDLHDEMVSIYDPDYVGRLIERCLGHRIDLLIPGLDDETLILSRHEDQFQAEGIGVIVAGRPLIELCRDKERLTRELNHLGNLFVRTYTRESLVEEMAAGRAIFPLIAKPRDGCASRGIVIVRDSDDLALVGQKHILQELAIPDRNDPHYDVFMRQLDRGINPQLSEISIQLVADQRGELLGRMFSRNRLHNGVPIEVIPCEDESVWESLAPLIPEIVELGLKGPLNIQGRMTADGLKLFEMNPRFTGITGLRALMGFNEVTACVKEWLGIDRGHNHLACHHHKFGIRQTADRALLLERNQKVTRLARGINGGKTDHRKNVLITGACGYLGRNLVRALLKKDICTVWVLHTRKDRIGQIFHGDIENAFDLEDFVAERLSLGMVDILLHLGFARPHAGPAKIAESLAFTSRLFSRAIMHHVPTVINISSQSVYDRQTAPPWTEQAPVAPRSPHAQAKYATELLLQSLKNLHHPLHCTSIRLGTLAGGADGLIEVDFLSRIVLQAYAGEEIVIRGGRQPVERLDIRDAVAALATFLESDSSTWKPVYNLGPGEVMPLRRVAEIVVDGAGRHNHGAGTALRVLAETGSEPCGLDSSLFREDMHWRPRYTMRDTIESLYRYFSG